MPRTCMQKKIIHTETRMRNNILVTKSQYRLVKHRPCEGSEQTSRNHWSLWAAKTRRQTLQMPCRRCLFMCMSWICCVGMHACKIFESTEYWKSIGTLWRNNLLDLVRWGTYWSGTKLSPPWGSYASYPQGVGLLHVGLRRQKTMSVPWMRHQCQLGLEWLRQRRIEGMIFLASCICDMGLEAVEFARKWIQEVGNETLTKV